MARAECASGERGERVSQTWQRRRIPAAHEGTGVASLTRGTHAAHPRAPHVYASAWVSRGPARGLPRACCARAYPRVLEVAAELDDVALGGRVLAARLVALERATRLERPRLPLGRDGHRAGAAAALRGERDARGRARHALHPRRRGGGGRGGGSARRQGGGGGGGGEGGGELGGRGRGRRARLRAARTVARPPESARHPSLPSPPTPAPPPPPTSPPPHARASQTAAAELSRARARAKRNPSFPTSDLRNPPRHFTCSLPFHPPFWIPRESAACAVAFRRAEAAAEISSYLVSEISAGRAGPAAGPSQQGLRAGD